jgi:pyruvate formate lyase activating enzyme
MKIASFQKFTALDYPGKLACIIFTQGCNLNCPFCHNHNLINFKQKTDFEHLKLWDFLESRIGKLEGVVVTGGEPTLHADLGDFLRILKGLGYLVKLDTNGSNPIVLEKLISDGFVDYIAMDLKQTMLKYYLATGKKLDTLNYQKSMELIRSSGLDYEFRTTVVPRLHSVEDILEIAKILKPDEKYYLQKYRNIGVRDNLKQDLGGELDLELLQQQIAQSIPSVQVRG